MSSFRPLLCCAWWIVVCAGCADESRDDSLPSAGAGGAGGIQQGGSGDSAPMGGTGAKGGHGGRAGSDSSDPEMDAGLPDAGESPRDAGGLRRDARVDAGSLGDAGWIFDPSCCKPHEAPGCKHAELERRVCEKLPSCCEEASGARQNAWDEACVLYVEHQYYDTTVRDCVCGADQAGQSRCCDDEWTNTCSQVAEAFCDAPWTC